MNIKRILLIVLLVIVVLMVSVMFLVYKVSTNNNPKGNHPKTMKGSDTSKQALVIYQPSTTDVMNKAAEQIAKGINDCGYTVTINYPGDHIQSDLSKYNIVVYGTPAYGDQPLKIVEDCIKSVKVYSECSKIAAFSVGISDKYTELDTIAKECNAAQKAKFKCNDKKIETEAYAFGKSLADK